MDVTYPSHRYLSLPDWAHGAKSSKDMTGLDLTSPLELASPQQAMLEALKLTEPTERAASGLREVREQASVLFGLPTDLTYVGSGISQLFRTICQSTLKEGDRVALCEPTPDWVRRSILAVGAAYIDIGRDWSMRPLQGTFNRLLEDGNLSMVFGQSLCVHTGTHGLDIPDGHRDLLVVHDHTHNPSPQVTDRGLHLIDLSIREGALGLPVCLALGNQERVERLWCLEPEPQIALQAAVMASYSIRNTELFKSRCEDWTEWRTNLAEKLSHIPNIKVTGTSGPGVMIRYPGMTSKEFQESLKNHDVHVVGGSSHTYHDHVLLRVPKPSELDRLTQAISAIET